VGRFPLAYTVTSPECAAPHPMGYQAPFEVALEDLASLGYEGVEIQVREPAAPAAGSLASALVRAGVRAAALATGPVRGEDGLRLDGDATTTARTVVRLREVVDLAAELDALVTIGGVRGGPASPEDQRRVADALGEVVEHADDVGVQLTLEPQHRGVGPFLCTVAETIQLLDERGWGRVGIVADSFHLLREERSWPGALVRAGSRLAHVQLGENHREALGTGSLPLTETLDVLDALGYRWWLVMEHAQGGDSHEAARRSAAAIEVAAPGRNGASAR
jgi:D-psicose/D-tagatose/L-ribulose 3-epimerase